MTFVEYVTNKYPSLRKDLRKARMSTTPTEYVKKSLTSAAYMGFGVMILVFFFLLRDGGFPLLIPLLAGAVVGKIMFDVNMRKTAVAIAKRGKAIDRDVLFAGRLLLIKLNSGTPLLNALEDAASGVGETTKYFQDILRAIELGTPLEQALERATEYCPSENLRKVLFQITNALKIGIDVTNFLEAILEEISEEQLTEIIRYGKKLSSLTMFYMLAAIVVPSLGMTMFIVVASMANLPLDMLAFSVIIFFLFIIQFIFITLFKSARPNIDL
jgi:pilus assembly protein TadC